MNESVLLITDFGYTCHKTHEPIETKDFDLNKLFQQSREANACPRYLLQVEDPKSSFKTLTAPLKRIDAAGGLVQNSEGHFLFIFRLGKWDLPKGKVDEGEKKEKAAVREVEEECGIRVAYRGALLEKTYHLYKMNGDLVLKRTYWYAMGVNKTPKLVPQTSEDISKAKWVGARDLKKIKRNTYRLVKGLIKKHIKTRISK